MATATSTPPPGSRPGWTSASRSSRRTSAAGGARGGALAGPVPETAGRSVAIQRPALRADRRARAAARAAGWIVDNLDADLSVPALADTGLHEPAQLRACIPQGVGMTPAAVRRAARIEAARIALASRGTPSSRSPGTAASARSRRCGAPFTEGWVSGPQYRERFIRSPQAGLIERRCRCTSPYRLFDRFTALDAIGPYEVLSRLPDSRVTFIAKETGPYKTDNGMLSIVAEASLDEFPHPEVLMVPGGWHPPADGGRGVVDWIRQLRDQHDHVDLHGLAAAGSRGRAGGPGRHDSLAGAGDARQSSAPAHRAPRRRAGQSDHGRGVSSGIDMALVLARGSPATSSRRPSSC